MKKKKIGRTIFETKKDSSHFPFSKLNSEELARLEKAKDILLPLKEKYKLSFDELVKFLEEELSFPISIFNKKLTVLESVVKFLREEKVISLHKISDIIKRDERNVWHIYDKAKKKHPEKFVIRQVKFWIPILIFSDTKLSALESVVWYLKEEFSLNYHEIALLLKRDDRTIWTVYQRAKKKNVKTR